MEVDRLSKAVVELADLVKKLRGPEGCPWDAKQTDSTMRLYLLEEAYEVLDAIENGSVTEVCAELGDLLFHILFLAQLAEERKEFDLTEVVENITSKMIRRHPHVFGRTKIDNADDVSANWARIKKKEKEGAGDTSSFLEGIPQNLPALMRAHRLTERASKYGNDAPGAEASWELVRSEFENLKETISEPNKDRFGRNMGRFLFSLANLTRLWGLNSEDLLRSENKEFADLFETKTRE